jgi:hypothetical protein
MPKGQARYKRSPAIERTANGRVYDSKKEKDHAIVLHALEATGAIRNLREQVPLVVCPKTRPGERDMVWRADFHYWQGGEEHWVDVKGHRTQLYILKKRLVKHFHGIDIEEV